MLLMNLVTATSPSSLSLFIRLRWTLTMSGLSFMNTLVQRNYMIGSEKKTSRFLAQFSRKIVTSYKRSAVLCLGSTCFTVQGKTIVSNLKTLS